MRSDVGSTRGTSPVGFGAGHVITSVIRISVVVKLVVICVTVVGGRVIVWVTKIVVPGRIEVITAPDSVKVTVTGGWTDIDITVVVVAKSVSTPVSVVVVVVVDNATSCQHDLSLFGHKPQNETRNIP